MYIIQNALKNVVRNRGRNILLGIILFAIIITSVVSLMINNTANGIIDDYKARFGSEVFITANTQKMMSAGRTPSQLPKLTPEQSIEFAKSEYIREAVLTVSQEVAGAGLHAVGEENDMGMGISASVGSGGDEYINPQFPLLGGTWGDFDSGLRSISDGRPVENDGECLVSTEFADKNGLNTGDAITLKNSTFVNSDRDVRTVTRELTVVGIYYDLTNANPSGMFHSSLTNRRNEILTTFDTVLAPLNPGEFGYQVNAKYFLKDPAMLADFENFMRANGLDPMLDVSADEEAYNKVVGPVEGMRNITFTFMSVVLILGAVIIILLASIAVRERKYEIGVLRAMGMKKGKVAFGLWLEMAAITCVCLFTGLIFGAALSQPITNALLAGQVESAKAAAEAAALAPRMMIIGEQGTSAADVSMLEYLDVSLGIDTFLEIILISLALASVAGLAAICKITKYEPIKILMERN